MALVGKRNGRNFGYGRQLSYAGPQALHDLFGNGHFATVQAHSSRWQAFARWCRSDDGPGCNDARQIDRETLQHYAGYLRQQLEQGQLSIATAQNLLSSVNRTLEAIRGDRAVRIDSPSRVLGQQRTHSRTTPPQGQDRHQVAAITHHLIEQDHIRTAAIVNLARESGMRLREAILADLPRLQREAKQFGRINIQDGTKGGRRGASVPRWAPVTDSLASALDLAHQASPKGSRNLLAPGESYAQFIQKIVRPARLILKQHSLKGFHELRAAYACERYQQLTHCPAPVNGGDLHSSNPSLDLQARRQISQELGHGREEVSASYIGGHCVVSNI